MRERDGLVVGHIGGGGATGGTQGATALKGLAPIFQRARGVERLQHSLGAVGESECVEPGVENLGLLNSLALLEQVRRAGRIAVFHQPIHPSHAVLKRGILQSGTKRLHDFGFGGRIAPDLGGVCGEEHGGGAVRMGAELLDPLGNFHRRGEVFFKGRGEHLGADGGLQALGLEEEFVNLGRRLEIEPAGDQKVGE